MSGECPGFKQPASGVIWAGMKCGICGRKKKDHAAKQADDAGDARWRQAVFAERLEAHPKTPKPGTPSSKKTKATSSPKSRTGPFIPTEDELIALREKSEAEVTKILQVVEGNLLFRKMDHDQQMDVVKAMWRWSLEHDQVLIAKGARQDRLFVVNRGVLRIDRQVLTEGQQVGDAALMSSYHNAPAAIAAVGPSEVWVLDRRELRQILVDTSEKRHKAWSALTGQEFETFLKSINVFAALTSFQKHKLVDALELEVFHPGQHIIEQGQEGATFYILRKGTIEVTVKLPENDNVPVKVTTYRPGDFFGELSLWKRQVRAATCTAVDRVEVLALQERVFKLLLGPMSSQLTERDQKYRLSVQAARLSITQKERPGGPAGTTPRIRKGHSTADLVIREGDEDAEEEDGETEDEPGSPVSVSTANQAFSFDSTVSEPQTRTVSPSISLALFGTKSSKEGDRMSVVAGNLGQGISYGALKYSDLTIVGTLGRGAFGHVQLVTEAVSVPGQVVVHAMKTVNKALLVELQQESHIKSEKDVLCSLNNPFVIHLRKTLNEAHHLHFLMEPALGGEMKSILVEHETLDQEPARFAAACVTLGFEYLHSKGICFRDLKPENLLLDISGYCKLTDFGFAKAIGVNGRTYTMCGTPDYLAPEVVSQQGHDCSVEWWTLGIFIYEMRCGDPPFWDDNPMGTYQNIMRGEIDFDVDGFTEADISIIKAFLCQRSQRLGVIKGGVNLIKSHEWFAGFDWEQLEARTLEPPSVLIKPISGALDLSNFQDLLGEDDRWRDYEPPDDPEQDPFHNF